MTKGYENIDDDKEKISLNNDDDNNNDTHMIIFNFFHTILITISSVCNNPRKYWNAQSRGGKTCILFIFTLFVILVLTLATLGIVALSYMSICENSDGYYLNDIPQTLVNLTNIVIFNRTPFGTIRINSESSNKKLQVSIKNYGLNENNRKLMTKAERVSQNLFKLQSASINTATVLGYDSTCENAIQAFTVDSGHHFLGKIDLYADEASDVIINSDQQYQAGKKGLSFNDLNVVTTYGDVNMTNIDAASIKITSTFDATQLSSIPTYLLNKKANGLIYLSDITVTNLTVSTIAGNVIIKNLIVKEGGIVNITTKSGTITLKNIGDGGDSYYISSENGNLIDVSVNGRLFHGSYNAQAAEGVVFFSPTSNMHTIGPLCSTIDSWKNLMKLREHVGALHHHCKQGSLGFAYGEQLLNIYAGKGDINLLAQNLDL